jgi:hypothetical protein
MRQEANNPESRNHRTGKTGTGRLAVDDVDDRNDDDSPSELRQLSSSQPELFTHRNRLLFQVGFFAVSDCVTEYSREESQNSSAVVWS